MKESTREASILPLVEESIHELAVIPCPLTNFYAMRAKNYCTECDHFKGVVSLIPNQIQVIRKLKEQGKDLNDLPWDAKFAIKCAYPIERKVNCFKVIE